jgi:hypothetical protein
MLDGGWPGGEGAPAPAVGARGRDGCWINTEQARDCLINRNVFLPPRTRGAWAQNPCGYYLPTWCLCLSPQRRGRLEPCDARNCARTTACLGNVKLVSLNLL